LSDAVLDRLQTLLLDARRAAGEASQGKRKKVFVDPGGRIRIGDDLASGEGQHLSEVHQAVFAARRG
jgi:hypothetical protein